MPAQSEALSDIPTFAPTEPKDASLIVRASVEIVYAYVFFTAIKHRSATLVLYRYRFIIFRNPIVLRETRTTNGRDSCQRKRNLHAYVEQ